MSGTREFGSNYGSDPTAQSGFSSTGQGGYNTQSGQSNDRNGNNFTDPNLGPGFAQQQAGTGFGSADSVGGYGSSGAYGTQDTYGAANTTSGVGSGLGNTGYSSNDNLGTGYGSSGATATSNTDYAGTGASAYNSDPNHEPSKMHGLKETMMGSMEKGIGKMTGKDAKIAEGGQRKVAGDAEREAAKQQRGTY